MKHFLDVRTTAGNYPVLSCSDLSVGLSWLWSNAEGASGWRRTLIVTDDNVNELWAPHLEEALRALDCEVFRFVFPAGEHSKTRNTKRSIEDYMLARGFDRSDLVIGIGGGIALDMAGFVAATFMRGMAHLNIATSLLAQVDAAVGGKTGVNTPHGKNLIGAFHQPRGVLLFSAALATLPPSEMLNGLAEAIKHAALWDAQLFEDIRTLAQTNARSPSDAIVERCVQIKAEIVVQDVNDHGIRQILNFGHTVAHAIELCSDHAIKHGQAVAIGMVIEARLAMLAGRFEATDLKRLVGLLERLELPTQPPCSFEAAQPFFGRDKKTCAGVIRCAIPQAIGRFVATGERWTTDVTLAELKAAWGTLCSA